ncbi:MAG: anion permease [Bacillales bacterium]
MDFLSLIKLIITNPALFITTISIIGVIFINGWTDAPNAIATAISTRAIKPKNAIIMASIFNFLGVLVMFFISKAVSETIFNIVDFKENYNVALVSLCSGMIGVVLWGILAWAFGIPSSESHALIAGITGAGLAAKVLGYKDIEVKFSINSPWTFVLYGLFLGCIFGFVVGFLFNKLLVLICYKMNRNKTKKFFKWAEIVSGGAMAFVHGAQDGLKFIGVFFLALELTNKMNGNPSLNLTNTNSFWYLALIVSLIMGVGTSIGGYKIIKKVGMSMARLDLHEGFLTDAVSALGIFLATFFGIPVSTTQVKTFSILGVGSTKGLNKVNWKIGLEMVLTWICTFPGAGLVGFILTLIFLKLLKFA